MAWVKKIWVNKLIRNIFLGLWLTYAVVATVVANFVVPGILRTWNDGYLNYRWAISFVPAIVHVFGVELRHQDRNIQWTTTLGSATTGVNLLALTRRQFHAYFVNGRNITFHFALKKRFAEPAVAAHLPVFAGIPHHKELPPEPPGAPSKKWGIRIDRVSLSNLKEIWFDRFRFDGRVGIVGGFEIVADKEVWVGPVDLDFSSGRLHSEGNTLLEPFTAKFNVTLHRFDPNAPDLDDVKFLDIDANIEARVSTLDFLNTFFRELPWLRAVSGGGPLSLKFKVGQGRLLPPAELSVLSKETVIDILDNRLRGDARILGAIQEKSGKREASVALTLDGFTLTDTRSNEKHLEGDGFRINARSDRLAFDSLFSKIAVDLDLEKARVSNLQFYNRYLPSQSGLKIQDGVGIVNASIHGSSDGNRDNGTVEIIAHDTKVKYADLELNGDVELKAVLKNGMLRKKRFDISGTQLKLDKVFARGGVKREREDSGWWGLVWFPKAKFQLATPIEASGIVRCRVRDVKPLLAVYSVKNPLPDMLGPVLGVQNLNASGIFQLNKDIVDFRDVDILGDDLRLRGRVRLLPWESHITLLAQHKMITVALDRINGDSRVILNDAEGWFLQQSKYLPVTANELGRPVTAPEPTRKDTISAPKKTFSTDPVLK